MDYIESATFSSRSVIPLKAIGLCLLGLLGLLVAAWFSFAYGYVEDDAFIHLEYARSLASGQGFAFNGMVTNGDTAPLWPILLAAIHLLGPDWLASAKVASVGGVVLAISGTWRLASELPGTAGSRALLPYGAIAVTVMNPYFIHWSFSGMESAAAVGLSLWAIWAVFLGKPTIQRCILAAALLSVAPLLRPELLIFDALAAPVLLWRWWTGASRSPLSHRLAAAAGLGLLLIAPVAIWCGYALEVFGSVVPNTNLAKQGGATAGLALRLASVYATGFPLVLLLSPLALLYGVLRREVPLVIWMLLLWPLACVLFYLADHTLVQTRYCLLSMPCMAIRVLWWLGQLGRPRLFTGFAAAIVLVSTLTIAWVVIPHVANKIDSRRITTSVSLFIRDHIPAGSPIAVYAIGQIGFESRHRMVDIGGITQPGVAPYMGRPEATLQWAKGQGARFFVGGDLLPEPGARAVFDAQVPFVGWSFNRSLYNTTRAIVIYELP